MTRKPFFSVIVPTYNQAIYLPAALESLQAQTFQDWEAVIVNDGSTDATAEVLYALAAQDSRFKAIHQKNGGVASALNKGLSYAQGEWICWLSSDDLFEPDKLEIHSEATRSNPDIRFFYSHFFYLDHTSGTKSAPSLWYPIPQPALQVITFFNSPYIHGNSIAVHRSVFDQIGRFDETSPCGQDFDMWLRISSRYPSHYIDRRTCVTRWHAGQTTNLFPEAGFFDSARACLYFLNAHKFDELFPLLDLTKSGAVRKAIQETVRVALNQNAIMYRLGVNTALLDRMGEWIARCCPEAQKPEIVQFIARLIEGLGSRNIPERIRAGLQRIIDPDAQPVFDALDVFALTAAYARELEEAGQYKSATTIRKYISSRTSTTGTSHNATIRNNFQRLRQVRDDDCREHHLPGTKILFYYQGFHDGHRPYAGTSFSMVSLARALSTLHPSLDVNLTGDHVKNKEQKGRLKVLPAPPAEDRQAFLKEFDIVVFATHMGCFKALKKPERQTWILHQHCWAVEPMELRRMEAFERIIALSDIHKHAIVEQGVPIEKVCVIPNAVDVECFSQQSVARIPNSILFAGALVAHKGLDILIRALPKVRQFYPQSRIYVYGDAGMWHEDSKYQEDIRSIADDNVIFCGARPNAEMPEIYSSHEILCLPSKMESFGLVSIEAQACGCIPVVHAIGGSSATLDDGRTGFLYAPNDPDTLADAIIKAFKVLEQSPAIRGQAATFVDKNFNIHTAAGDFLEMLEKIRGPLSERGRTGRDSSSIRSAIHGNVPIHFFTIVLNGEPFIRHHLDLFRKLPFRWHWHIIEGVADLKHDTAWSLSNGGHVGERFHSDGLSVDGTTAYLDRIAGEFPEHITLYRKPKGRFWDGKLEMVNAPLVNLSEQCLLWQIDADELWTAHQIETMHAMFQSNPDKTAAYFFCHFFVGPQLVTVTRNTYGNHTGYEWLRIWRYSPGDFWRSHEPPRLVRSNSSGGVVDLGVANPFSHAETESRGLVFQHYAYATEEQVRFKESYYGYKNAVRQWQRMQNARCFPVKLKNYLSWVKDETQVATVQARGIHPLMDLKISNPVPVGSAENDYKSILWLRTDSIGDAVLAAGMLPVLRRQYPNARITVVCQKHCKEIYETCPAIDGIITIPNGHKWIGSDRFSDFLEEVKQVGPDLLLNSVFSEHSVSDVPRLDFIPRRIALRQSRLLSYTDIIPTPQGCLPELERNRTFLRGLGIEDCEPLTPVMWLRQDDLDYAEKLFEENNLQPDTTIALFVGSRLGIKQYFQWGRALSGICRERGFSVITLGGQEDYQLSQWQLDVIRAPALNLCGRTSLRRAAAILSKCRLAVGTDTCLAHMACAMGVDNVVVLGGGHFGRFFPYSPQTTVVCNPLDCYGCEWQCHYRRAKCIQEIAPETMEIAVNKALDNIKGINLQVFAQTEDLSARDGNAPAWYPDIQADTASKMQIAYLKKPIKAKTDLKHCCKSKLAIIERQSDDRPTGEERPVLISAIVSTYNSEDFIKGCLEDLEAQTIADQLEIIVVDSASPQNEGAVVKDFQSRYPNIRYMRTRERESIYAAWNRGIKLATGKYITNANTDDRHRRDALEQMVKLLEAKPDIDLVYADAIKTQTADESFERCTPTGMLRWYDWDRETLLKKGCFIGPQPVWRRKVHDIYGYFDERYSVCGDYEFWLRISQTGNFHHVRQPLGLYLDRPDSVEHANQETKRREERQISEMYKDAVTKGKVIGRLLSGSDDTGLNNVCDLKAKYENRNVHQRCSEITAESSDQGGPIMYSPETILDAIRYLAGGAHRDEACWFLDKLIADYPDLAAAHSERAQIAYEQDDMGRAQKHYELAAGLAPHTFEFQKNLGDFCYAVQQDGERALNLYEKALALEPNNVEVLTLAGHLSVSLHRFEKAKQYYSCAVSNRPDDTQLHQYLDKLNTMSTAGQPEQRTDGDLYALALERAENGDRSGALSALRALIDHDAGNALAHNDIGILYYEAGENDKALAHYQEAVRLSPENAIFQKNLGDLSWFVYGDAQAAMTRYMEALKLEPQDVEALLACSQICMSIGKNDDARDFIDCVLTLEPWNEEARRMMNRIDSADINENGEPDWGPVNPAVEPRNDFTSQNIQVAIDELLQTITESPQDARAFNDLGVLYFESGDKNRALHCYEQAVSLQPRDAVFVKNLADFYLMEQGRIEDALKMYVSVLEDNPQDVDCLISTGLICRINGKIDDASDFYQRALEIEPWNQSAREALEGLTQNIDGALGNTGFRKATA